MEPLGPTISAPPSGNALAALNFIGRLFFGLMRRGLLGGRKSKMKSSPTMNRRCGAMGIFVFFFPSCVSRSCRAMSLTCRS